MHEHHHRHHLPTEIHISFIIDLLIQHQFVDIIFNHTQSTLLHYLVDARRCMER